jgi:hypothetical protein
LKIDRLPAIFWVVHVPPNHVEKQTQVQFWLNKQSTSGEESAHGQAMLTGVVKKGEPNKIFFLDLQRYSSRVTL